MSCFRLYALDQIPAGKWDGLLNSLEGGLFSCRSFSLYQKQLGLGHPVFLAAEDSSGEITAAVTAFLQSPRLGPLSGGLKTLITQNFPALRQDSVENRKNVLKALEEYAKENHVVRLYLNSFWSYDTGFIKELGYNSLKKRWEFEWELGEKEEDLLGSLNTSWRRKIRKTQKEDFTVQEDAREPSLNLLFDQHAYSLKRKEEKGAEVTSMLTRHAEEPLHQLLHRGCGRLFTAWDKDQPLSSLFVLCSGDEAALLYAGTSKRGYQSSAGGFLLYKAAATLAREGVKHFNLGGVPVAAENHGHKDHGLYRFKSAFSTRRELCCSGGKYLGWRGRVLQAAHRIKRFAA